VLRKLISLTVQAKLPRQGRFSGRPMYVCMAGWVDIPNVSKRLYEVHILGTAAVYTVVLILRGIQIAGNAIEHVYNLLLVCHVRTGQFSHLLVHSARPMR
jgi:hypothetical protein